METEPHPERLACRFRASESAPDLERAAQRVYRARKLGKCSIAHCLENAAVQQMDFLRDEGLAARQAFRRLLLGSRHHGGVANDIADHEGSHLALHRQTPLSGAVPPQNRPQVQTLPRTVAYCKAGITEKRTSRRSASQPCCQKTTDKWTVSPSDRATRDRD